MGEKNLIIDENLISSSFTSNSKSKKQIQRDTEVEIIFYKTDDKMNEIKG